MRSFKKNFVWVFFLLSSSLFAAEEMSLKLKVEHLACESCVEKIKSEISSLCKELTIDQKKGEVLCRYEPPLTADQIFSRAKKSGLDMKMER